MSEVTRKLASFRKVDEIKPIEGADKIELAILGGWQVVTQKGWAKPDMLVCYFEIDSFLPIRPEFEFLRKSGYRAHPDLGEGFKLKTIKLRGELSQGLIMPMEEVLSGYQFFPEKMPKCSQSHWYNDSDNDVIDHEDGQDLTESLGIKLWEPPLKPCLKGMIKGNFPSYIQKTDQERIQNIMKYIPRHAGRRYQVTLKVDGSSMTVYRRSLFGEQDGSPPLHELGVCSRNYDLKPDDSAFWRAYESEKLEEKITAVSRHLGGNDIALQGELMGPGVQGNREKFPEFRFYLYDIWSITDQQYLDPLITYGLARNFAIRHVPTIEMGVDFVLPDESVDWFLQKADVASINHEVGEGIVFKAVGPGPRHSFKVVNNKFLLAEKD